LPAIKRTLFPFSAAGDDFGGGVSMKKGGRGIQKELGRPRKEDIGERVHKKKKSRFSSLKLLSMICWGLRGVVALRNSGERRAGLQEQK